MDSEPTHYTDDAREAALTELRDGLAALNRVPAAGLSTDKHADLLDAIETVEALERALANEVEQQRSERDSDSDRS